MDVRAELNKGLNYFLSNQQEMVTLYKQATGVTISFNCDKCVIDAFKKLQNKYDDRKYKMKRGAVINNPFGDNPPHYTRVNTTDEISEKLINLGYGKFFE